MFTVGAYGSGMYIRFTAGQAVTWFAIVSVQDFVDDTLSNPAQDLGDLSNYAAMLIFGPLWQKGPVYTAVLTGLYSALQSCYGLYTALQM
jgi:hypothetical protein